MFVIKATALVSTIGRKGLHPKEAGLVEFLTLRPVETTRRFWSANSADARQFPTEEAAKEHVQRYLSSNPFMTRLEVTCQ